MLNVDCVCLTRTLSVSKMDFFYGELLVPMSSSWLLTCMPVINTGGLKESGLKSAGIKTDEAFYAAKIHSAGRVLIGRAVVKLITEQAV